MDAYEDGVGMAVGKLRALLQGDQEIGEASATNLIAVLLEKLLCSKHDIKRRVLFLSQRSGGSAVDPAVARVKNDRPDRARGFLIFCGRRMGSIIFTTSIAEISVRPSLETIGKQSAYLTPLM